MDRLDAKQPRDADEDAGDRETAVAPPSYPPVDENTEGRPSWVDVRDSWVGDRQSGSEHATTEATAADPRPRTVPPPLPPPDEPMTVAAREDVRLVSCRADGLAPSIMMERLAASDYGAALRVAEAILRHDPDDPDALQASAICKSELGALYRARLGDGARVPRIVACAEELREIPLDAHAGLVLSLIDGRRTIDEISTAGRVPPLYALRILSELFLDSVIVLFDPGERVPQ